MKAIKGSPNHPTAQFLATKQFHFRCSAHLVRAVSFEQGLFTQLLDYQRSDPAVKQILLTMNERQSFIIEDLDDYHLVIKVDEEYRIRKELEIEVGYNSCCLFFSAPTARHTA